MENLNKILGEGTNLTESQRATIQEAWDKKLSEARDDITEEIREEFAQKFEHDKNVLVETLDKFLEDKLRGEIEELAEDKKGLVADRVAYRKKIKEHSEKLEKFMTEALAKEIAELREDREAQKTSVKKLENFVLKNLAEEIGEFREDKKKLAEQRVKMLREGKRRLKELQQKFVNESAKKVNKTMSKLLESEINKFRSDIEAARQNHFGRKIFEAYASEFLSSYLVEGTEFKKLKEGMDARDQQLAELKAELAKAKKLNESVTKEARTIKESAQRSQIMYDLMSSLNRENREIMQEMLKDVRTDKLKESFNKYLPVVLKEDTKRSEQKSKLNEGSSRKVKNGDKKDLNSINESQSNTGASVDELSEMIKLAGIKK